VAVFVVARHANITTTTKDVFAWRISPIADDDTKTTTIAAALGRPTVRPPKCMSPEQFRQVTNMLRNLPMVSITSDSVKQTLATAGCPLGRSTRVSRQLINWLGYVKRNQRSLSSKFSWIPEQLQQLCRSPKH